MNRRWRNHVTGKTNKNYTYEKTYHRLFRRCRHCVIPIRVHHADNHNEHDHHDTRRARRARHLNDHHANPITIKVRAFPMARAWGACHLRCAAGCRMLNHRAASGVYREVPLSADCADPHGFSLIYLNLQSSALPP
jgi:hypothetical protein